MGSGFQPPIPGPQDSRCVLWHDFESLTAGNLWRDRSRNELHATPINYVAPNYGLTRTSKGKGACTFNGTNQRGDLATPVRERFYTAGDGSIEYTLVLAAHHNVPAVGDFLFCSRNAGGTRGLIFYNSTAERLAFAGYDAAGAAAFSCAESTDVPLAGQTRVSVLAARNALAWSWEDGAPRTVAGAGSGNALASDNTRTPAIGAFVGGGNYFDGTMYFFAIFRDWTPNVAEAKALTTYVRDQL